MFLAGTIDLRIILISLWRLQYNKARVYPVRFLTVQGTVVKRGLLELRLSPVDSGAGIGTIRFFREVFAHTPDFGPNFEPSHGLDQCDRRLAGRGRHFWTGNRMVNSRCQPVVLGRNDPE